MDYRSQPSRASYLYSSQGYTTAERIAISNPTAAVWQVYVYGYQAFSGVTLRITASGSSTLLPAPQFLSPSVTATSATLNWTWDGNAALASDASLYLRRSDNGVLLAGFPASLGLTVRSRQITGLTPSTSYRAELVYKSKTGTSHGSSEMTFVTTAPVVLPAPVLTLGSLTASTAQVNWQWSGASSSVASQWIYLQRADNGANVAGYPKSLATNVRTFTFGSLTRGFAYRAVLVEKAAAGFADSSASLIFTPSATIPSPTLTVSVGGPASLTASWSWSGVTTQARAIELDVKPTSSNASVTGFPVQLPVAKTGLRTIANLSASTSYRVILTYRGASGYQDASAERTATTANLPETRIVLLLHGLNSNPGTWNTFIEFMRDRAGLTGTADWLSPIVVGTQVRGSGATMNGVLYYRQQFGLHDYIAPHLAGVEGITSEWNGNGHEAYGDFSTFDELGLEVQMAIRTIQSQHPNAKIMLVGHSRGGLAARAFLQNHNGSPEQAAVTGLLTIGTPHLGSPLGRLYSYLESQPRSGKVVKTWEKTVGRNEAVGSYLVPEGFVPWVKYDTPVGIGNFYSSHGPLYDLSISLIRSGVWECRWTQESIDNYGHPYDLWVGSAAWYTRDETFTPYALADYGTFRIKVDLALVDQASWDSVGRVRSMGDLDARKPGVGFLADNSPQMATLNASANRLPAAIKYGSLYYDGLKLGRLKSTFGSSTGFADVFDGFYNIFKISPTATRHCIGTAQPSSISGDGIVPASSQQLTNVPGISSSLNITTFKSGSTSTDHVSETAQSADILFCLRYLIPWW